MTETTRQYTNHMTTCYFIRQVQALDDKYARNMRVERKWKKLTISNRHSFFNNCFR